MTVTPADGAEGEADAFPPAAQAVAVRPATPAKVVSTTMESTMMESTTTKAEILLRSRSMRPLGVPPCGGMQRHILPMRRRSNDPGRRRGEIAT